MTPILTGLMAALFVVLPLGHVPALRVVLAAIATAWGLALLVRDRQAPLPLAFMAAWLALGAVSWLWSIDRSGTLHAFFYNMLLPAGVFYAGWRAASEPARFKAVHLSVLASAVLLGALVVIALAAGRLHDLLPEQNASGALRYWPGVGVASTFACLIAPFALLYSASERVARRAIGAAVLALLVAVAAATLNRAVWPALFVTIVAFVVWLWPALAWPKRRLIVGVLIAAFAAGSWALQYANSQRHLDEAEMLEKDSRLQGWREWIGIAMDAPVLGHGLGRPAVQLVGKERVSASLRERDPMFLEHGHNILIDVTVELGLVGLALYIALLASLLRAYWGLRAGQGRALGAAGIALIIAMLAKNSTDDFMGEAVIIAFWAYAGVLLGALEAERSSRSKPA